MRCLSVIAPDQSTGFYYPGFVDHSLEDGMTMVWFYRRLPLSVLSEQIIVIGGAVPWPRLNIWDYALVRVYCKTFEEAAYIPARVVVLPTRGSNIYTLQLYTGMLVHKRRRLIVKIGKERYRDILGTIFSVRHRRQVEFQANAKSGSLPRNRSSLICVAEPASSTPYLQKHISLPELWRIHPIKTKKQKSFRRHKETPKRPPTDSARHRRTVSVSASSTSVTSVSSRASSMLKHSKKPTSVTSVTSVSSRTSTVTKPSEKPALVPPTTSVCSRTSTVTKSSERPASVASVASVTSVSSRTSIVSKRSETPVIDLRSEKLSKHSTRSIESSLSSVVSSGRNRKLRSFEAGQEILARWPDDGWYYFSVVVTEVDSEKYVVRDSIGHIETVHVDDLMTESQKMFQVIQPADHVIGLHPNFLYSYAPATIRQVYNPGVLVQFFDGTEARLPLEEVYKLAKGKYKLDVDYIRECEERTCRNRAVIARDDNSGFYFHCVAEFPNGRNEFIIRLPSGALKKQSAVHVFERSPQLSQYQETRNQWLYVLAPLDPDGCAYFPAVILQHQPLRVQFADGSQRTVDSIRNCFYLNEAYYENAVNFYMDRRIESNERGRTEFCQKQGTR